MAQNDEDSRGYRGLKLRDLPEELESEIRTKVKCHEVSILRFPTHDVRVKRTW